MFSVLNITLLNGFLVLDAIGLISCASSSLLCPFTEGGIVMNVMILWDETLWSVIEHYRHFVGTQRLPFFLFSPEDRLCMFFQNIGKFLAHCVVSCLRWQFHIHCRWNLGCCEVNLPVTKAYFTCNPLVKYNMYDCILHILQNGICTGLSLTVCTFKWCFVKDAVTCLG